MSTLLRESPRARVMRHVKEWIDDGVLACGQSLPSERTIADKLNVNRSTVHGAMELLVSEGFVAASGPQRRLVVAARRPKRSLIGGSIVIIAPGSGRVSPGHRQPGWGDHVSFGALQESSRREFDTIAPNPGRFNLDTIDEFARERPYGVVIPEFNIGAPIHEWASRLQSADVPVVINRDTPDTRQFDRVASDHGLGDYLLAKRLASVGCKRILCLVSTLDGSYWFDDRLRGYTRAMHEFGMEPLDALEIPVRVDAVDESTFDSAVRQAAGYLVEYCVGAKKVDAIMAVSDGQVSTIAAALRLFGLTPNGEILITGYDNYWAEVVERKFEQTVPYATVDKQNEAIGAELVRLLCDRVEGRLPSDAVGRSLAPTLVDLSGCQTPGIEMPG